MMYKKECEFFGFVGIMGLSIKWVILSKNDSNCYNLVHFASKVAKKGKF